MKTVAGLWIDHRKAIIVTISDKGEKTQQIVSNVEKQHGRISGKRSTTPFASQLVQPDDSQQRGFTGHLNTFYNNVVSSIGIVEAVLIFGPGEAKGELKKVLEQKNPRYEEVVMEPADKMTDHQVAARVRRYAMNGTAISGK